MKKMIQKANRYVAGVGACFLIPLMIITAIDVLCRDLLNRSIPGSVELSQYMLSVFILLGMAYTQQVKGYVEVSILTSRLPLRIRLILKIITLLLGLFILSILTWQGFEVGMEERTVSDMLRIPQYPFRLLVAVAAFFLWFELLFDLINALKKTVGRTS